MPSSFMLPSFQTAPPCPAVLPENVQFVTVIVPPCVLEMAPPNDVSPFVSVSTTLFPSKIEPDTVSTA